MDVAVFSYLNTLAARRPSALGRLAVATGQDRIFLYSLLFLGLWVRPVRDALRGPRLVVLAAVAVALSLGVNTGLNAIVPRPRPSSSCRRTCSSRGRTTRHSLAITPPWAPL